MQLDEILSELPWNRGYFPRRALQEAIARREEIPPELLQILREAKKKIGRNEPCPCGSGKKYKKGCVAS